MYEDLILADRERVHSESARPLMQIRRQRGEAPFGYFKMFGGLRRFAGRGLAYATKKTLIAAAGWNLLLLVKKVMRDKTVNAPISSLIRLAFGLWNCLQRLWQSILNNGNGQPGSSPHRLNPALSYRMTVSKATLSGGC